MDDFIGTHIDDATEILLDLYDALFIDRNLEMAEKILKIIEQLRMLKEG